MFVFVFALLNLPCGQHSSMTCYVEMPNGGTLKVKSLPAGSTVRDLKERIQDLEGGCFTSREPHLLVYGGKSLEDDNRKLLRYGLKHLCVVRLEKQYQHQQRYQRQQLQQRQGQRSACKDDVSREPGLVLYPTTAIEDVTVRVGLSPDWTLCALYPRPSINPMQGAPVRRPLVLLSLLPLFRACHDLDLTSCVRPAHF